MPDRIIFDSTVISNFLLSNAEPLILSYYKTRGNITREVYDELTAGARSSPALQNIDRCIGSRNFELITLSKKEHAFYGTLLDSLGRGEASCIAFAKYSGGIVATDDKAARKICESLKIPLTGTIGILIMLARLGHSDVNQADMLLSKMIEDSPQQNCEESPRGKVARTFSDSFANPEAELRGMRSLCLFRPGSIHPSAQ